MAQKHLKELLKEDQEPFHLKDYIADRQFYLKKQAHRTQIQLKKPKPISKNTSFFCKNACFFSLNDSPSPCKSPLFDFAKSPCKSPNRVFLHVPSKTASMLLEAAIRIQKQTKPKTQIKNSGFGLFGSIMKRLTHRNRTQKLKGNETEQRKTGENSGEVIAVGEEDKVISVTSSTSSSSSSSSSACSCNGRQSSLDLESSSSGRSFNGDEDDDDDGFEFANLVRESDEDYEHCLSPLSPFHFALRSTPSPDHRSPVKSPVHNKFEDNVKHELERTCSFHTVQEEDEDEEDKEQNSPVSVLDPQFEDDYDEHEDDGYGVECNYSFMQRAKQHLLHKLQMFEKLAGLDPMEFIGNDNDGLMLEQAKDYNDYDYESNTFDNQMQVDKIINGIVKKTRLQGMKPEFKRLVLDLITEEENVEDVALDNDEQINKRVCKRLESWKEVEANTIDMMVEMDLKREIGVWKKSQEQIGEVVKDLEVTIFAILVDEFVEDISCCLIFF